jgi:hypothetical protein
VGFLDKLIHAVRQDSSTSDLLRAIRALSERIGSTELAEWADRELRGYTEDDDVPAYRGPFDAEIHVRYRGGTDRMSPLPRTALAEELRQSRLIRLYELTVLEPIEDLERLGGGPLVRPWTVAHVDLANRLIEIGGLAAGGAVVAAENRLAAVAVRTVLDAVRTRVLGLALTLERVAPDAGDDGGPSAVTPPMRQIIVNTIA